MTQQSLPVSAANPPMAAKAAAPASRKRLIAIVVVLVIAAGAFAYWLSERRFEETDDAQIDGTISNVSPRVSGNVSAVHVVENQTVKAGDVLAEIDPVDLRITLDQAQAQVAQAQAQLDAEDPNVPIIDGRQRASALTTAQSEIAGSQASLSAARKDVEQLTAQLVQAKANDRTAQLEKERSAKLVANGSVPSSRLRPAERQRGGLDGERRRDRASALGGARPSDAAADAHRRRPRAI